MYRKIQGQWLSQIQRETLASIYIDYCRAKKNPDNDLITELEVQEHMLRGVQREYGVEIVPEHRLRGEV